MKRPTHIGALLLALAVGSAADPCRSADATWIVVSDSGSSLTAETMDDALIRVAELRLSHPKSAIEVRLPPGITRLRAPVTITAQHAPSDGGPLTIRGADDHTTVLVGSVPIKMRAATAADFPVVLPPSPEVLARAKTVAISLDDHPGPIDLVGRTLYQHPVDQKVDFFEGGRRLHLSRWPKVGYSNELIGHAAVDTASGPTIEARNDRAGSWAKEPALWMAGYWASVYAYESAPVLRVEAGPPVTFQIRKLRIPYTVRSQFPISVLNAYSELSEPGEYVVSPRTRQATLIPYDQKAATVDVPRTTTLVRIVGAAHVNIDNVALEETLGTALLIERSKDIVVRNGLVRNTGNHGIEITRSENIIVERMTVTNVAQDGVFIDAGDRKTLTAGNVVVRDSIFTHFGELLRTYGPGVELHGVGNRVEGCYFAHGPHSAILVYGNEHRIENNEISDVVTESADAGAIYLMGFDWTQRGNIIRGNLFHDIRHDAKEDDLIFAVYLDGGSSEEVVADNIFLRSHRPIFINGGRDNTVQNNLFIDSGEGPIMLAATSLATRKEWDAHGLMHRSLDATPYKTPPWSTRYPQLLSLQDSNFEMPENNRLVNNATTSRSLVYLYKDNLRGLLEETGTNLLTALRTDISSNVRIEALYDYIQRQSETAAWAPVVAKLQNAQSKRKALLYKP